MATTETQDQTTTGGAAASRGPGRASARGQTRWRDDDLDLLTAALLGVAVGVAATLAIRRGPSGRSPLYSGASAAGRGARWAGAAGVAGAELARRRVHGGRRRGRGMRALASMGELVDVGAVGDQLGEYLDAARGAIEDTVSGELESLRRSLRRRRRQLGL